MLAGARKTTTRGPHARGGKGRLSGRRVAFLSPLFFAAFAFLLQTAPPTLNTLFFSSFFFCSVPFFPHSSCASFHHHLPCADPTSFVIYLHRMARARQRAAKSTDGMAPRGQLSAKAARIPPPTASQLTRPVAARLLGQHDTVKISFHEGSKFHFKVHPERSPIPTSLR